MSGKKVYSLFATALLSCAGCTAYDFYGWDDTYGTYDVSVGPIWDNGDAQVKCRQAVVNLSRNYPGEYFRWNGNWTTLVQGQDSVCGIESSIDLYNGYY